MATETILFPPSNRVLPGSRLLPTAPFPDAQKITFSIKSTASPDSIASDWISSFTNLLGESDTPATRLFLKESCWRDLLCMTWDFAHSKDPKIHYICEISSKDNQTTKVSLDKSAAHKVPQLTALGELKVVQACLNIETSNGIGERLVRLTPDHDDGSSWKALALFTTLQELKGHEEKIHIRRPTGLPGNNLENGGLNWKDRLLAQRKFECGREPTVLILGRLQIAELGDFKGDRLVHSSKFTLPTRNAKGRKAVVVGCCNSGHDIARDSHDHAYDVTMVQRSSTLVLTSETLIGMTMKGLYAEDGVRPSAHM